MASRRSLPILQVIGLAALAGLLGGCAAPAKVESAAPMAAPATAPTFVGVRPTRWGELPEYRRGEAERAVTGFVRGEMPADGVIVADLLVERNGNVRDVAVVRAGGTRRAVDVTVASLRRLKFPPLAAIGPDLYVVQQVVRVRTETAPAGTSQPRNMSDQQSQPVWVPMPGGS